jgi:hypothetical protein
MSDDESQSTIDEAENDALLESLKFENRPETMDYVVLAVNTADGKLRATSNLPDNRSIVNLLLKVRDDLIVWNAQQISEANFERTLELVKNPKESEPGSEG